MDNKRSLGAATGIVIGYLGLTLSTLAALVIMAAAAPRYATTEAWVHAIIVAVFAVVLTLRLRAARAGDRRAVRAVGIIAAVLLIANLIEAATGLFPGWMRIEMIVIAALMAVLLVTVVRGSRQTVAEQRSGN
ncbi:hypothetical protein [Microlunatus soli]|uniref:SPW repeat-containing protein n=1 Tax=Microlunatus soli TaxID=630515 RepID=A0A1H1TEE7_9ACTN|nr:hypothetical protein [Microlunatus soli]SDS58326.1 hypothetical protein SAMN04489812_2355 [Microlunatus soli]